MARPLIPLVRGGGFYSSRRLTPLVYRGGFTRHGSEDSESVEKTVSGSVVSVADALEMPVKNLSVSINPIQDLHGYDNPWPAGGGKNIFTCYNRTITANGVTVTCKEHYIEIEGTASANANFNLNFGYDTYVGAELEAGEKYTWSVKTEGTIPSTINIYGGYTGTATSQTGAFNPGGSASITVTSTEGTYKDRVWISVRAGDVCNGTLYIQTEKGSTATAYAPYSNICPISGWTGANIYHEDEYDSGATAALTISWQTEAGTVYGGTLDVTNGVLTVDRAMVDLGTLEWAAVSGNNSRMIAPLAGIKTASSPAVVANIVCTALKASSTNDIYSHVQDGLIGVHNTYEQLWAYLSEYTDAASFKTAMSGVMLCYPLATPVTYQLTPQEIAMFKGVNNLWANTGDMTLTYFAAGD